MKIEMGKDGQARTAIRPCVAGGSDPIQWIRSVLKEKGDACQGGCDQLNLRNLLEKTIYKRQPLQHSFNSLSTHSRHPSFSLSIMCGIFGYCSYLKPKVRLYSSIFYGP